MKIIKAFFLPVMLVCGTIMFCLGLIGNSTIAGNPIVSLICGALIIGGSATFIVVGLYDYFKIIDKQNNEVN